MPLSAVLLFAAGLVQTPPALPPEARHFDFWKGRWEVFDPSGTQVGRNTISIVSDGEALLEQWEDLKGGKGTSLNFFDLGRRKWRQVWMGAGGGSLDLAGGLDGGRMVLVGEAPNRRTGLLDRITWTPLEKDAKGRPQVRQHWEQSPDGGKTWKTAFDGRYVKVD